MPSRTIAGTKRVENRLNMDMISPSSLSSETRSRLLDRRHPSPHERKLGLQRQFLGTYVVATEQRHATEHAVVAADQLIEIFVAALIARIQPETRHLVDAGRADEILAHARGAAGGDAAAALDAAVELVYFLGPVGVHTLFQPIDIGFAFPVHPGLEALAHLAGPGAGIHGQVADELEHRQRRERDFGPQ